jgi:hypothetical protein
MADEKAPKVDQSRVAAFNRMRVFRASVVSFRGWHADIEFDRKADKLSMTATNPSLGSITLVYTDNKMSVSYAPANEKTFDAESFTAMSTDISKNSVQLYSDLIACFICCL